MNAVKKKEKGLGRGLDALFMGEVGPDALDDAVSERRLLEIETAHIHPGRYQPRTRMDEASISELADSIREQGLLLSLIHI